MERAAQLGMWRMVVASVAAWGVLTQSGCIGLVSNLLYDGRMVKARYDGLKEQKVAVVCLSGDAIQSPHSTSSDLACGVQRLLKENVPEIQIIDQEIVADWIDNNNWDQVGYDCRKIGRGVVRQAGGDRTEFVQPARRGNDVQRPVRRQPDRPQHDQRR